MTGVQTCALPISQIQDMPVVSSERDATTQARPAELSAFLLGILTRTMHPDDDYWDTVKMQMTQEPDMDAYGIPSTDVTAYIARRSRCSELCNGCGMDPLLVDAMMGHAPPKGDTANRDNYLRQPDNWPIVASMTERIVYDPERTTNPAFAQTHLAPGGVRQIQTGKHWLFLPRRRTVHPPDRGTDV